MVSSTVLINNRKFITNMPNGSIWAHLEKNLNMNKIRNFSFSHKNGDI